MSRTNKMHRRPKDTRHIHTTPYDTLVERLEVWERAEEGQREFKESSWGIQYRDPEPVDVVFTEAPSENEYGSVFAALSPLNADGYASSDLQEWSAFGNRRVFNLSELDGIDVFLGDDGFAHVHTGERRESWNPDMTGFEAGDYLVQQYEASQRRTDFD